MSRPSWAPFSALLLAVWAAGCLAYEPIRRQAATDLECTTHQIEVVEQEGLYQVSGCGRMAMYQCSIDNRGEQHCMPIGRTEEDTIRMIAPGELSCPRGRLKIRQSEEGLYRVEGCGKQEIYLCRHDEGNIRCSRR